MNEIIALVFAIAIGGPHPDSERAQAWHDLQVKAVVSKCEELNLLSLDLIGQMEQTLNNIVVIVKTAGGDVKNIVRLTWYIKDKSEYLNNQKLIGEVYQRIIGKHYPAMSMIVVKDLIEDEALLEIEATALIS